MGLIEWPANGSNPDTWDAALKEYADQMQFQSYQSHISMGRRRDIARLWTDIGQPGTQTQITSLVYLGNDIVVGGTYDGNKVIRSTDRGDTFSDLGNQCTGTGLFLCYVGNGIVLGISYGSGKIIRSTDYGATWSDLGAPTNFTNGSRINYYGNGVCVALDYNPGRTSLSTDYGATWGTGTALGSSASPGEGDCDEAGRIFIPSTATGDAGLYMSDDNGASYTNVLTQSASKIIYLGNGIWLLLGSDGHVYRSTDASTASTPSWTDVGQLGTNTAIRTACRVSSGVAVVFGATDGKPYRTEDWGETFTALSQIGSETGIYSSCIMEGPEILVGTSSGHVWKSGK